MEHLSKLQSILLSQAVLVLHARLIQNQMDEEFAKKFVVVVKPLGL